MFRYVLVAVVLCSGLVLACCGGPTINNTGGDSDIDLSGEEIVTVLSEEVFVGMKVNRLDYKTFSAPMAGSQFVNVDLSAEMETVDPLYEVVSRREAKVSLKYPSGKKIEVTGNIMLKDTVDGWAVWGSPSHLETNPRILGGHDSHQFVLPIGTIKEEAAANNVTVEIVEK